MFKFHCYECNYSFTKEANEVEEIIHPASPCACEYCGWDEWTEHRTHCPKCGIELDDI